jgi:RHS repeat-associated protein
MINIIFKTLTMKYIHALLFIALVFFSDTAIAQQVEVITTNAERYGYAGKSYIVIKSLTLKPGFIFSGTQGTFYAKVHPNLTTPAAPSLDQNFVRSETILKSGITTEGQIRTLPLSEKLSSFNYMDGDGKLIQAVAVGANPQNNDVVQPSYFDGLGRAARQYLPYAAGGASGQFRPQALSEQGTFYNNSGDKIQDDTQPYAKVTFEDSFLARTKQGFAPGTAWNSKPITNTLKINDAGVVREWSVVSNLPSSSATYPAGSLAITEVQDEENFITRSYADRKGWLIMTETSAPGGGWAQTYYVRDVYGKVLFIIPPVAATTLSPDQTFADRWYFQYEYDQLQRQTGSKAPGAGWSYTIYDKWDRAVLTQNANQRAKSPAEWDFVKYDELNRTIATGIYKTNTPRSTLITDITGSNGRSEIRNGSAVAYTLNQTYPSSATEADLLSVTYYDDYGYVSNSGWDVQGKSYAFVTEQGYAATPLSAVKDFVTGSKVRIVGTNTWLNSVVYYDNRYRTIQTTSENQFEKNDRLTTEYDFIGQAMKTCYLHTNSANQTTTVRYRYGYDIAGRLLNKWHQVNSQPEVLLSSATYDELGQLVKKKLHSSDNGSTWLQALDFRYNIRGWLTNVNYINPETGDPTDYFGMELAYEKNLGTGNTPRYDGVITAARWKLDSDSEQKAYNFDYDAMKRFGSGTYKENIGGGWNNAPDRHNESTTYDVNGNIAGLNRNGNDNLTTVSIDNLGYTYNGNQLVKVDDTAPTVSKNQGFKDGTNSGNDYEYDANGNLTIDRNKNITVTYNAIDLPEQVTFADNSKIIYTYAPGGLRLSQTSLHPNGQVEIKTDYVGDQVYVNNQLAYLQLDEGRVVTPAGDVNAGIYQYYLTDHLGSVRVVLTSQPAQGSMMMATMEDGSSQQEEDQFIGYDNKMRVPGSLVNHTKNVKGKGKALRLNGVGKGRTGLATSLSVMPGDTVSLEVFAKYIQSEKKLGVTGLVESIAAVATSGISTVAIDGGAAASSGSPLALPFGAGMDKSGEESGEVPRAYMNWVFFDRHFVMKNAGYKRISEKAKEDGTNVEHEQLMNKIAIEEPGYVYVFLSNEEQQPTEVYFDDFNVTVIPGPVIQVNDYYPYGMTAFTWVREGEKETKEKFQGKEFDEKTGWHDFHARQYDPALGRFESIDPKNQFSSPYMGMGDNPVNGVDPDGQWFLSTLKYATGLGPVINVVAAARESLQGRGADFFGRFFLSMSANTSADFHSIAVGATNMVNASIGSAAVAIVANDWDEAGEILRVGFVAPFDADIATLKTGGISTIAASGVNSAVAGINAFQHTINRTFGDDSHSYEGRYSIGDDNAEALVWFKRNKTGANATVVGNSIVFKKPFFEKSDLRKQGIFAHEAMHVRQQKKYGTGGEVVLWANKNYSDPNPSWTCDQSGRPTPCGNIERAVESYNDGAINLLEIEAELEQLLFEENPSSYKWSNIPILK